MTSEELRNHADNLERTSGLDLFTDDAVSDFRSAADTIERLERENEELKETIRGKLREVVETATNVGNTNVQLRREIAEAERLLERFDQARRTYVYPVANYAEFATAFTVLADEARSFFKRRQER